MDLTPTQQRAADDLRALLLAHLEHGAACPVCERLAKQYRRRFNRGMARCLAWLFREDVQQPSRHVAQGGYSHVQDAPPEVAASREFDKLALWGLAEQKENRSERTRTSGLWRVTDLGTQFVLGAVAIPSHAHVYQGEVVRWGDRPLLFADAVGEAFDYRELGVGGTPLERHFTGAPTLFDSSSIPLVTPTDVHATTR